MRADDLPFAATLRRLRRKFKVGHSKGIRGLFSSNIEIGLIQIRSGIGPSRAQRYVLDVHPRRIARDAGRGNKTGFQHAKRFSPAWLITFSELSYGSP